MAVTPTVTQWMKMREYLISCNLPIDPSWTGTKQDLRLLRARIGAKYSKSKARRILSHLHSYLEESTREKEIAQLFRQVSDLLYELQKVHMRDYDTMCFMSKLSDDAIRHMRRRRHADIVLLTQMRDALIETTEYLRTKNKEEEKS